MRQPLNSWARWLPALLVILLLASLIFVEAVILAPEAQALPEYSAQTGEPCASCHISPSGGGPRGVRGQAWVGSGKPGTVPDTTKALDSLGITFDNDPADYLADPSVQPDLATAPAGEQAQAQETIQNRKYHYWLRNYDGN